MVNLDNIKYAKDKIVNLYKLLFVVAFVLQEPVDDG